MKKIFPFIFLFFSCSPDAIDTEPAIAEAKLYVNGDTINFDKKYFTVSSDISGGGFSILLNYTDSVLQDFHELGLSGFSHSTGMFLIDNDATGDFAHLGYYGFSPNDTNIHYYSPLLNTASDSNYIQIHNMSTHRINGDFHCYLWTYNDTVYTGLSLATGYFDFVMP